MFKRAAIASIATLAVVADPDAGFLDWFTTELGSAHEITLDINGTIPSYVEGMMVQAGPGQFEMGEMHFGHALDGFSKVLRLEFASGKVKLTTDFLRSQFYNESVKEGKIAPGMLAAETTPPSRKENGPLNGIGPNDNNYIKPQKIGDTELMTCDTLFVSIMDNSYEDISETIAPVLPGSIMKSHFHDDLDAKAHLCIQATMAHGVVDHADGSYTAAMGCQTADMKSKMFAQYHKVFKINPKDIHKRELVASIELKEGRRPSYMHQNAPTENHYTIVGQPLYMDIERVMLGASLAEGGLVSPADDTTIFQIVKLSDGSVRSIEVPGFLLGHVINSYEDGDDIVLDVTWYNPTSGGFFTRYLLGNIRNKSKRDAFPKSKVVRFRLKADGKVEQTNTLALSTPDADVELPAVNPNNEGNKYCVIWGVEFSAGGRSFASTALMKRNICTGEAVSVFEEGVYVSEHRFIPRPGATEEDDGTLVGLVFDSRKGESAMHVRDGKTLELLASAWMALKVPFPVHATWFGENAQTAIVV